MSWRNVPVNGWMTNMQRGHNLRWSLPGMILLAAFGHWQVQATSDGLPVAPLLRDSATHYRPPFRDRLVFKAPPSQLFETWRCDGSNTGTTFWASNPCRTYESPYDRPAIHPYTDYSSDLLPDPFAPQRFMSQPYPLRPPQPRGEPVPGAPPSQLPTDRNYPSGVDFQSPQLLR